jgi:hypothetical protein
MIEEHIQGLRAAILKTVAFFDTMDYPPTWTEVTAWMEMWEANPQAANDVKRQLLFEAVLEEGEGRLALSGRLAPLLALVRERTPLFPRKLRTARKVAKWLARNPAVRFVALANTTSLAHARDGGDLDFFVIVRHGYIWSTRLLGGAPYRLTGRLSGPNEKNDAVCLSYFISDASLDLSPHMLPDDPYFRYWFLALLPLFDDGISKDLWAANTTITSRHPNASPWMMSPALNVKRPWILIPGVTSMETPAEAFQKKWFPQPIRERMNKDTSVLVSDNVLKFHVDDGREAYRQSYEDRLQSLL